jgi:TetR/AcrR family transcriptional regulator, transcriptional repressor for nem operon
MARPREFDEGTVLDAAVLCFWKQGYEATSVRDLVAQTGITAASLYNAFGDKRALYQKALDHYVDPIRLERPGRYHMKLSDAPLEPSRTRDAFAKGERHHEHEQCQGALFR